MTLERVFEPEVMDSPEEASDYNAMDHAAVNRAFVDDSIAAAGESSKFKVQGSKFADGQSTLNFELGTLNCTVLDLGTGTVRFRLSFARARAAAMLLSMRP